MKQGMRSLAVLAVQRLCSTDDAASGTGEA
jgi:hypothetical protein